MLSNEVILALVTALSIILVWLVKSVYPVYFFGNTLFAPILTALILAVSAYIYKKVLPQSTCVSPKLGGAPGSCELDADCNAANGGGWCQKKKDGSCGCMCRDGWSGPNCEVKGIPWDSPNCMGSNKQPAKKDKNGLCVCPNENWVGDIQSGFGWVQCAQCSGSGDDKWGPDPSTGELAACSNKWRTIDMASNSCFSNPATASCDDFNSYLKYLGPTGEHPSITPDGICSGNDSTSSCRCGALWGLPGNRVNCKINSWIDPTIQPLNCANVAKERPCSSYKCVQ